jgi:glycosyltransferase involved in cell wall biosynthesis
MRVCFYDDSTAFGGHEVMAIKAAAALSTCEGWAISFIIWSGNARLRRALEAENGAGARISVIENPVRSLRPNPLRAPLAWTSLVRTRRLFQRLAPDVVVVVQGRIETGLVGLLAARLAGFKVVSYLPMAHTLREMGKRLLPHFRDRINLLYYRLADGFVTISPAIEAQVRRFAPRTSIRIVENLVLADPAARIERGGARAQLLLPQDRTVVAMIGRVEFSQKGHDLLVRAVADGGSEPARHLFLVVGDGPDLDRLKAQVNAAGIADRFAFLPWRDDMVPVYSAIDLLVLPSRFEGVPLVMLEALAFGVPVVASNRDGMMDWIPPDLRFEPEAPTSAGLLAAITAGIAAARSGGPDAALVQRARRLCDIGRFAEDWRIALGEGARPDFASPVPRATDHAGATER